MNNLTLILEFKWFDKIVSGEKTSEYRKDNDYYKHKLFCKKYDTVTFLRGYTQNKATFKLLDIVKTNKSNDLEEPSVYELKLGERIDDRRNK